VGLLAETPGRWPLHPGVSASRPTRIGRVNNSGINLAFSLHSQSVWRVATRNDVQIVSEPILILSGAAIWIIFRHVLDCFFDGYVQFGYLIG
jgi:hypothetical protein